MLKRKKENEQCKIYNILIFEKFNCVNILQNTNLTEIENVYVKQINRFYLCKSFTYKLKCVF